MSVTNSSCPACGAPVPARGACLDRFHALLVLEGTFPGAPGSIVYFYAIACYNFQHPDSLGLTAEALEGLRRNLAGALDGKASVVELGRRTRLASDGRRRVRRRSGDPPVDWYRGPWPVNLLDVLIAETDNTSPVQPGCNAMAELALCCPNTIHAHKASTHLDCSAPRSAAQSKSHDRGL
jgi:hypothetical protein